MAIDFDKYMLSTGTHYISNSGKDENGAYHGGAAGDQSGHEWELKPWYNRPWSVVLRHPNQAVARKIAELGIAAALNNKIGYDQYQRETYWKQLQAAGYDPSKITVACEEDCTAGVSSNVKAVGYLLGIQALKDVSICSSRNMRSVFTKAGFTALTAEKYLTGTKYLLPGDVLLYENHHAATNVTCGAAVRDQWLPETQGTLIETVPPAEEVPVDGPYVRVTASAFIRSLPTKDSQSMGVCGPETKLPYLGYSYDNYWHLVKYNDRTGWISRKCSEVVGGTSGAVSVGEVKIPLGNGYSLSAVNTSGKELHVNTVDSEDVVNQEIVWVHPNEDGEGFVVQVYGDDGDVPTHVIGVGLQRDPDADAHIGDPDFDGDLAEEG